nr:HepT-like ribonuclease domain-containing protein [Vulcanisaeta sp. EB80]
MRVLRDGGLIDEACLRDIVALIRLRNLLVHRYWVIDDERVYWSVRNNFKCILALLDSIRGLRGR